MNQRRSRILMVRPVLFSFNEQTSTSNLFQQTPSSASGSSAAIQQKALEQFDSLTALLETNGIEVIVFDDTATSLTPDSIFPNNWISFHDKTIVLYPMMAENRRLERRPDVIAQLKTPGCRIIDLTHHELNGIFLEGTGSIVFDYKNQIAYAGISPRTDQKLLESLCEKLKYAAVTFKAVDVAGAAIYHTNVMMCIGAKFAVICKDSIVPSEDAERVIRSLRDTGHEIIVISINQMNRFAGNMYQLYNDHDESVIVMSEQACQSLTIPQLQQLGKHGKLLHAKLDTIEQYGGGSARCMIADIRLD